MKRGVFLLLLIVAVSAGAQCVTSYYPVNTDVSTISVTAGTFPNNTDIAAAYGMWNSTCSGSGNTFPRFNQSTSADINIHVDLRGASTNGGCGFFDHVLNGDNQVVGGTVVVFQYIPATPSRPQIDCSVPNAQHQNGRVLRREQTVVDGSAHRQ